MFNPETETIMEYILRKAADYPNKRDLVRESGVSDWNISKMLRQVHKPRIDIVQPLFTFFIKKDAAEAKRKRKAGKKELTVN